MLSIPMHPRFSRRASGILKGIFGEEKKSYHRMVLGTIITRYSLSALFMIVSVLISRALGVEGRGALSWMVAYSGIGMTFASLGVGRVLRKYIPRYPEKAPIFSVMGLLLCLFGIIVVSPFLYEYGNSLAITQEYHYSYLLLFLLWPLWVIGNLQGEALIAFKKGLHFNVIFIVEKCTYALLCTILLFMSGISPASVLGVYIIAGLLKTAMGFAYLKPQVHYRPSFRELKNVFCMSHKLITSSYITQIMGYYSSAVLTVLLGAAISPMELGYFSTARLLTDSILFVPSTMAAFALPQFSQKQEPDDYQRLKKRMLILSALATLLPAVFMFIFPSSIIHILFGKAFLPAGHCLRIMSVGMVAIGIIGMAQSIIISGKNELILMASTGMQLLCITALMFLFGDRMDAITASYIYSATYVITMIVTLALSHRAKQAPQDEAI